MGKSRKNVPQPDSGDRYGGKGRTKDNQEPGCRDAGRDRRNCGGASCDPGRPERADFGCRDHVPRVLAADRHHDRLVRAPLGLANPRI